MFADLNPASGGSSVSYRQLADRIAVIHAGTIVELGNHAELMARGGAYAGLYAAYVRAAAGGDDTEATASIAAE